MTDREPRRERIDRYCRGIINKMMDRTLYGRKQDLESVVPLCRTRQHENATKQQTKSKRFEELPMTTIRTDVVGP